MKVILFAAVILLNVVTVAFILGLRMNDSVIGIVVVNLMIATVIQSILSFHMWNAIHDGKSQIHPFLAAGLHYIPVLGFLWTLISFAMYPSAFVSYAKRRHEEDGNFNALSLDASPFNHYVMVSFISVFLIFIPVIKIIVPLVSLVMYLRVIATACGGVEDLKFAETYAYSLKTNQPVPAAKNSLSLSA